MQIEVKGRNLPVTDELRECVSRRFEKVVINRIFEGPPPKDA